MPIWARCAIDKGKTPAPWQWFWTRATEGKLRPVSVEGNPSEGGEEMLVAAPAELLEGLLDGLNAQCEMTELLEELFYDGLS